MKTELRGGPGDGKVVDAPLLRVAPLIDIPDAGVYGVHRYRIVGVHGVQHLDGTSELSQWATYVGYFPLRPPLAP